MQKKRAILYEKAKFHEERIHIVKKRQKYGVIRALRSEKRQKSQKKGHMWKEKGQR